MIRDGRFYASLQRGDGIRQYRFALLIMGNIGVSVRQYIRQIQPSLATLVREQPRSTAETSWVLLNVHASYSGYIATDLCRSHFVFRRSENTFSA